MPPYCIYSAYIIVYYSRNCNHVNPLYFRGCQLEGLLLCYFCHTVNIIGILKFFLYTLSSYLLQVGYLVER